MALALWNIFSRIHHFQRGFEKPYSVFDSGCAQGCQLHAMKALIATVYFLLCAYAAPRLYSVLSGHTSTDRGTVMMGRLLCAWVVFFVPFFVLGFFELITDQARVDFEHAVAFLAIAAIWLPRHIAPANLTPTQSSSEWNAPRALLVFIAAGYLLLLAFTLAQYPRGFEVAAYQLPSAVHILQNASLQAWDPYYPHTFPQNPGLYFAFLLHILPERIAAGGNFILVAVVAACVYQLSRQIGAERRTALIAVSGLLTLPMVAFAAGELNADLGGAAFLCLAVFFACAKDAPQRWLLSGLAAGLAFGFKTLHLVPIGFLFLCALSSGWRRSAIGNGRASVRFGSATSTAAVFSTGVLITAGFWIARNWITYGNPFYPVNVPIIGSLMDWSVDPAVDFSSRHSTQFEWVATPWHWIGYPWFEWHQFGQHFKFSAGLGAFFATAVPVAWFASLVVGLRYKFMQTWRLQLLSVCSALILAVWWLLDDRQPRYLLGMQILLMPLTAWFLSAQTSAQARMALERLFSLSIIIMLFVSVSKEAANFGSRVILSNQTTRAAYYDYPPIVDRLPSGSTILNLGSRTWHYPLFGERMQNQVISTPKARNMLGLPPSLGRINNAMLLAEPLRREGVDFIFSDSGEVHGDHCIFLHELYKQTVNQVNKQPLPQPRVLYRASYCENSQQTDQR